MMAKLIEAYLNARRIWEARFDADSDTAGSSPEWDTYMAAEEAVFDARCATIEEIREKARFVICDEFALDSLMHCYREIDGKKVPSLESFLRSLLGAPGDESVKSGEKRQ